jgi:hypothetical protein
MVVYCYPIQEDVWQSKKAQTNSFELTRLVLVDRGDPKYRSSYRFIISSSTVPDYLGAAAAALA